MSAALFTSQLIYKLTLVVLTSLVLLTLASQFGQYLYFELSTHFRLQYVLASLLCAIVLTAFQAWKFLPIAIFCAALNLVSVVPYYRSKEQPKGEVRIRFLHANVLEKNRNYGGLIDLVTNTKADVVVLQELTPEWNRQTIPLQQQYPFVFSEPRLGGGGMAIFSRYPFEETQRLKLDDSAHLAIFVRVNVSGKPVSVLAIHPTTPVTRVKFTNRNRQFSEAASLLRKTEGHKVLIGDFNTTMWSPYFTQLLANSGLRDARLGFGLNTSWPLPMPSFLRMTIDHCLVSEGVGVEKLYMAQSIGSDHLPLIVDLSLQ